MLPLPAGGAAVGVGPTLPRSVVVSEFELSVADTTSTLVVVVDCVVAVIVDRWVVFLDPTADGVLVLVEHSVASSSHHSLSEHSRVRADSSDA